MAKKVAIVGGGASGMALASLLGKLGVSSVVFERDGMTEGRPRAHYLSPRTLETFESYDGMLAREVREAGSPGWDWERIVYCERVDGKDVLAVSEHNDPNYRRMSDVSSVHLPQHRLLSMLRKSLIRFENVHVKQGCEVSGFRREGSCVEVLVREGRKEVSAGKYAFLVGADGARSIVRHGMGSSLEGDLEMQHLMNLHFRSVELGKRLLAGKQAVLYFLTNPSIVGVLVAHDLPGGEFVLQVPFFPKLQPVDDWNEEKCLENVQACVLEKLSDAVLLDARPWTMAGALSERFSTDRVFLIGDAAHVFPPSGGFGLNAGIQDAHNLAWKIASVLGGSASYKLLGSYERERKASARMTLQRSLRNLEDALRVPRALGFAPERAQAAADAMDSIPLVPSGIRQAAFESVMAIGKQQVRLSQFRLEAIRRLVDEGKTLRLHFPEQDFGIDYATSNETSTSGKGEGNDARGFVPSIRRGQRTPHCWIQRLEGGSRTSTLSLFRKADVSFVLLCGHEVDHSEFEKGLKEIVPLRVARILRKGSDPKRELSRRVEGMDLYVDVDGDWYGGLGARDDGVVLSRPDSHVLWDSDGPPGPASLKHVHRALQDIGYVESIHGRL